MQSSIFIHKFIKLAQSVVFHTYLHFKNVSMLLVFPFSVTFTDGLFSLQSTNPEIMIM